MTDDTRSKELILPEDEPWLSHGFISKIAAQVSLPYRKPKDGTKEIVRRNGTLEVCYMAGADSLPYGKYPRLFELWACTMIKTNNPCFNPETNTINLGTTFREFLRLIGVQVGGKSLRTIKPQLERLFKCVYIISNNTETKSQGVNFTVAEKYQIDWLQNEPQAHGLFENWVCLSQRYVEMLRDHPVPVDLKVIANLRKPMAIDVYWWLTKRVYGLHEPVSITWQQLYQQFGSDTKEMKHFKERFKDAVFEVIRVYPCKITCGPQRVTVFPNQTSVPTVAQMRAVERRKAKETVRVQSSQASPGQVEDGGHWIEVSTPNGKREVWWTSEAFNAADAQSHLLGWSLIDDCPVCRYDQRNRDGHESAADTLF